MTLEQAHALSRDLAEAGFAHTVTVGVHDSLNPAVQPRVDLHLIRTVHGGLGAMFTMLEEIAARHDAVLHSSLSQGYSFSDRTAHGRSALGL